MSTINVRARHRPHDQTNNGRQRDQVIGRVVDEASDPGHLVAVERFVAAVLRRAHETAAGDDNPDEARAIFHVAVAFAGEMETTIPEFDRFRFIEAATGL